MDASHAAIEAAAPADLTAGAVRARAGAERLPWAFAVLFASTLCLVLFGYRFGTSNHAVYLVDALRRSNPELLQHDWFTTQTLQYHAAFGVIAQAVLQSDLIEPGFLISYLALLGLLHWGWLRLVRLLGGSVRVFLLSVVFFYLSAGGTGLGMYQFLQDASFLPSNVANVAMLWAMVFWIAGRYGASGACFGVAGLFHLNHALVGIGLWGSLSAWNLWKNRRNNEPGIVPPMRTASYAVGSVLSLGLSGSNIALALQAKAERSGGMPLDQFVDLYVRLRHPHHYDPSSWPVVLWIAFLWSIPFALYALSLGGERAREREQTRRIFLLLLGLQLLALIGAGIWYVSESLVQMSLYRFSIYVLLLGCIATALVVRDWTARRPALRSKGATAAGAVALISAAVVALKPTLPAAIEPHRASATYLLLLLSLPPLFLLLRKASDVRWFSALGIVALPVFLVIAWEGRLGMDVIPADDADYLAMCDWVRENTPADAVFLVPPQEQVFRIRARRAIVVNFKGIPQLSGEMVEWRRRLQTVLDLPDLRSLPRGFGQTLSAIAHRYHALPTSHLEQVAEQYGARYLLLTRPASDPAAPPPVHAVNDRYFLYDLRR